MTETRVTQARVTDVAAGMGALKGHLDSLTHTALEGWAINLAQPDDPVALSVSIDGQVIGRMLANRFRAGLRDAGIGLGYHGFRMDFPALSPLAAHAIRITREADGAELLGGARHLSAATTFDEGMEQSLAGLLANLAPGPDQARALAFLTGQTALLLARHADQQAGQAARQAHALFQRRWGGAVGTSAGAGQASGAEAPQRRALVIDDHVPRAGRDAGSVAILSHMRALAGLGYAVSLVATHDMADEAASGEIERQEGITVHRAPYTYSVESLLKRQASCFDLVYLHRCSNAEQFMALVRRYQPRAHVVYAVADLHNLRLSRQAEVQSRPELAVQSQRVAFAEMTAAHLADAVITHSPFEAQWLRDRVPAANVHVVPWAVPVRPSATAFTDRSGIAFVGQFGHAPNPDAVFWLTRHIMPLVWARNIGIRCLVVGYGWDRDALLHRDDRIEIVGAVADMDDVLSKVRLTVAPLRFGAGIKGKVLESLAAGVPCIMSPVAAEGLVLSPVLRELVHDGAEAIAHAIVSLYEDAGAYDAMAAAGLSMIAAENAEQTVIDSLSGALA